MRKTTLLLSLLLMFAMVLAACGAEETITPGTDIPPITAEATETMPATEVPTETSVATEPPGVPVTGAVNPARVSNELEFSVVDQSGNQVGSVNDMILDLDDTSVAYVVVDADGRSVAVPWENMQLQTGTGTGTGTGTATEAPTEAATEAPTDTSGTGTATVAPTDAGGVATGEATAAPTDAGGAGTGTGLSDQNAFVLLTDPTALDNAPAFDPSTLPPMGQSAAGWDAALLSYWQGVGTGTGAGQATQAPTDTSGTGTTGTATAAPTDAGVATAEATAAPTDTSGTGTQGVAALQGIALASDVIGSTITVGAATGTGTGTGQATEAPTESATEAPTDTSGTGTTATVAPTTDASGSGTGTTGSMSGTVEDIIVDTESGDILYVVLNTTLDTTGEERLIPVPVSLFQWDGTMQGLVLNIDTTMLQSAPTFQEGQFPDTSMSDWNSEIDSFWQTNGGGSGSGGAGATATP